MEKATQLSFYNDLDTESAVDNLKKPIKNIVIRVDESLIESNLAEMPFINYYKTKKPVLSVEYLWTDSKGIEHGLEVRGSKHGVPTANEFDTLLGLFKIYSKKNGKIIYNSEKEEYDLPVEVEFTYRELAKELGYKTYGGSVHKNLVKSVETLMDTTIYNRSGGGMFDINDKRYVNNNKAVFHIIEHMNEETQYFSDNKFKEKIVIKFNPFFFKSMKKGYLTKYMHEKMIDIKSDVAKKLMLILTKWKGNRKQISLYYETLYQRIPLPDTKPNKYRNKRIKDAAEELIELGFIESYNTDTSKQMITFYFEKSSSDDTTNKDESYCARDKFNSIIDVINGFKEFGLSDEEINGSWDISKFEYYKALLRYVFIKKHYGQIDDVKKYLKGGFIKSYDIDKKFYTDYEVGLIDLMAK